MAFFNALERKVKERMIKRLEESKDEDELKTNLEKL